MRHLAAVLITMSLVAALVLLVRDCGKEGRCRETYGELTQISVISCSPGAHLFIDRTNKSFLCRCDNEADGGPP